MNENLLSKINIKRIVLIITLGGVLLLGAACGGPSSTSPAPISTAMMENPSPVAQPTVGNYDVCSLVATADVEAVLGQTVTSVTPGSEPDPTSGATLYSCTYLGNGLALIVSSADLGTAKAASDMMQAQFDTMKSYQPDTVLTEESGVGDKIFWTERENAVAYNVLKGSHLIGVAIGGSIGDPASYKAGLLLLTEIATAKQ